jgi:malic enzyme
MRKPIPMAIEAYLQEKGLSPTLTQALETKVPATGRSDFVNQVKNAGVFPSV